jgi:diaminohydroxyphosphoribosylaminopyrimidine deaminase/5-amino-6-(5-phosphoribosylamino)uracil reductase
MGLALEMARQGQGCVEPNPMVGCVIVNGGRVVGQGCHEKFGEPHAEPNALRAAGRRARGATAYVTLEPCGHFGKTPPCTDALIQAGVRRVVAAMKDPNPLVAGKGTRLLRAAGIAVEVGLLGDEAAALNAPFITFHTKKRPYVILKWAQSIDGKIATRTGDSKWITALESRAAAHALRARVDAIIVGVGTVIADDPELTARLAPPKRSAARIVLDPHLRTPLGARVVRTARRTTTIIVVGNRPSARKSNRLGGAGCEVLSIATDKNGIRLPVLLKCLRDRGMTNVLVEGGGRTLGAFVQAGLADEAWIFVAPTLIGGETAPGPLRNLGPASMRDLPAISCTVHHTVGPDLCYNVGFADSNRP